MGKNVLTGDYLFLLERLKLRNKSPGFNPEINGKLWPQAAKVVGIVNRKFGESVWKFWEILRVRDLRTKSAKKFKQAPALIKRAIQRADFMQLKENFVIS